MKVYYSSKEFPKTLKNPVVALGNFDGVHLAHQKMFQKAKNIAKKIGGHTVAYTFNPHPVKVLSQATETPMINTLDQKLELLKNLKLDAAVVEPFDKKFAHMEAEVWFDKVLRKRLHVKALVAGYDFTFGRHREGTSEILKKLCKENNIQCEILTAQLAKNTLISSSQIRQLIMLGKVNLASQFLGHPYFLDGKVIQGFGRGAAIGIPTANLKIKNEILPAQGVYACRARVKGKMYDAVTNIGMNPTFGGKSLSVESHLLHFRQEIYGETIRLYFQKKIREEKSFSKANDLVEQIHQDIEKAEKILRPPQH